MVAIFKGALTAEAIKEKARALGADLVGIADGAALESHPPDPDNPQRPSDITDHDGARVIVLAKQLSRGVARIAAWNDRHKYYNDELALTRLEEASLELVYWLEDNGYPAIIVPPTHSQSVDLRGRQADQASLDLLSLPHAAVEAGLGTLGLESATADARIRPARGAHRRALLGRCRLRHAHRAGAVPRARPARAA